MSGSGQVGAVSICTESPTSTRTTSPATRIGTGLPSVTVTVARPASTVTLSSLPWRRKGKLIDVHESGSRGAKVRWSPLSTSPANPCTSAAQIPPALAMWTPSAVLPWVSARSR